MRSRFLRDFHQVVQAWTDGARILQFVSWFLPRDFGSLHHIQINLSLRDNNLLVTLVTSMYYVCLFYPKSVLSIAIAVCPNERYE
jgi:hypothetical protein